MITVRVQLCPRLRELADREVITTYLDPGSNVQNLAVRLTALHLVLLPLLAAIQFVRDDEQLDRSNKIVDGDFITAFLPNQTT